MGHKSQLRIQINSSRIKRSKNIRLKHSNRIIKNRDHKSRCSCIRSHAPTNHKPNAYSHICAQQQRISQRISKYVRAFQQMLGCFEHFNKKRAKSKTNKNKNNRFWSSCVLVFSSFLYWLHLVLWCFQFMWNNIMRYTGQDLDIGWRHFGIQKDMRNLRPLSSNLFLSLSFNRWVPF